MQTVNLSNEYEDLAIKLENHFERMGFELPVLSILYEATPFLELLGEELGPRLLQVNTPGVTQACLRPEFTIPICLYHLSHRSSQAQKPWNYAYCGPVFRLRADQPTEFYQTGAEFIGDQNELDADMKCLAEASEILTIFEPSDLGILAGDSGVFLALLNELNLPKLLTRRLTHAFGNAGHVAKILEGAKRSIINPSTRSTDDTSDVASIRAIIGDLFAASGLRHNGERSLDEITDRYLDQLEMSAKLEHGAIECLQRFFQLQSTLADAPDAIDGFARREGISLDAQCEYIADRATLAAHYGINEGEIEFSTTFGQQLGYYSGFAFEIHDELDGRRLASGGRYNALLERLGADSAIPATGFSIWLDSITGEAL